MADPKSNTETIARRIFEWMRWKDDPRCPFCGGAAPYRFLSSRASSTRAGLYKCHVDGCRRQFTVTVGTLFAKSHVSLSRWLAFDAALREEGYRGTLRASKRIGIKYRTAHYMMRRLRRARRIYPWFRPEEVSSVPMFSAHYREDLPTWLRESQTLLRAARRVLNPTRHLRQPNSPTAASPRAQISPE